MAADPGTLLELREVSVAGAGGRPRLEAVSLRLARGEIVTLIGPNGAGKTTLVRVALGLEPPTAGSVWRRPGLRVGYQPQRLALDPRLPLPVRRFLALTGEVPADAARAALAEVGAAHLWDRPLHRLSGGELQRVGLARVLARRPELLVLDEPSQGIDLAGQETLFEVIRRTRDRTGCAVLMVSHDLHLVMAGTDRVLCLDRHVCCQGRPEAVSRDPAFGRLFGSAALALYSHHHDRCEHG
ncbi:ATP-binding cassette domain-containing protein [Inmirania thermothiophila]|uniref:Zinc transport system ATP-binding protein n=1 Tax=Inmirania thermothiophila TaxID=1750597 RepID=A0A3N1XZG6_9GAMM|nr:ATP-binding cassette domain-containing protein [Inmirania thermothiophila]ROR31985.1 zinc transport system ATP-binding protein [Inmirania thermothiophila]